LTLIYGTPLAWPRTRFQYETEAKQLNRHGHDADAIKLADAIDLNGVPALEIYKNVDGDNPGSIDFAVRGTRVTVAGYRGDAALREIAQSIVDRARSAGGTALVPPSWRARTIKLREAPASLGGPVPLPAPALLKNAVAQAVGDCPHGDPALYGCGIEVTLAGQPRALVYERATTLWRPTPDTPVFKLDGVRVAEFRWTRFRIKPATWVMSFVIAGTRVEVGGRRDFVRDVAKSIIDRWHSR
jgi:hypothetical protein